MFGSTVPLLYHQEHRHVTSTGIHDSVKIGPRPAFSPPAVRDMLPCELNSTPTPDITAGLIPSVRDSTSPLEAGIKVGQANEKRALHMLASTQASRGRNESAVEGIYARSSPRLGFFLFLDFVTQSRCFCHPDVALT